MVKSILITAVAAASLCCCLPGYAGSSSGIVSGAAASGTVLVHPQTISAIVAQRTSISSLARLQKLGVVTTGMMVHVRP